MIVFRKNFRNVRTSAKKKEIGVNKGINQQCDFAKDSFINIYIAKSRIGLNDFVSIIWSAMVFKTMLFEQKETPIPANVTIHISYSLSPTAIVFESPIPYWSATCNIALLLQNL